MGSHDRKTGQFLPDFFRGVRVNNMFGTLSATHRRIPVRGGCRVAGNPAS